jgi:Beta-propeller repeat
VPVNALAVAPGTPSTVYLATDYELFRSADGGASWAPLGFFFGSVTSLAVDPASPSTVYAGVIPSFGIEGVFKSTDGGDTWSGTGLAVGVRALAISPSAPSVIYAGTDGGVFESRSGGGNWTSGLRGVPVTAVAVDPTDASIAYAGTESGLFKTISGGAEWFATLLSGMPVIAVAIAPSLPSTLYVATWFGSVVTDDGAGESWRPIGPSAETFFYTLAVDPNVATKVYAGTAVSWDGFVARINPDGSALEYSTYIGGSSFDYINDAKVDSTGNAYVVGATASSDFPVQTPMQSTFGGIRDLCIAKISSTGALGYATYLGGSAWEDGGTVDVDATGQAHVAGYTLSRDFPVRNAWQAAPGGGSVDAFVTKLDESGSGPVYSTYFGGSGEEAGPFGYIVGRDPIVAIAVTQSGEAFISGTTTSTDLPVLNAVQGTHAGGEYDGFVTKFSAGGALEYSTFLGGSGAETAARVAIDPAESAVVVGFTSSTDFRLSQPFQAVNAGEDDVFVARLADGGADVTPPTVSISSPQSRDYLHSERLTLSFLAVDEGSGLAAGSPSATLDGVPVTSGQTIDLLTLALGSHAFSVSASDVEGNQSQQSVTFRVVATFQSLIDAVNVFSAQGKISPAVANSLVSKLTEAKKARDRGNETVFRNKLDDFINQVRASSGGSIAADAAQVLIADAEYVLAH